MSDFAISFAYLMVNEGGLGHDFQGLVNYGLEIPDLTEFFGHQATDEDLKNLSLEDAKEIYKKLYWTAYHLDLIEDPAIATALFDVIVNQGPEIAISQAQRALYQAGKKISIDGFMGPETIGGLNNIGRSLFIMKFKDNVITRYEALAQLNPGKYGQYLRGWSNRANRLLTLC